jgi:glyoxylase-like metal-dependent hydrolase (beta-lactamase superfamily II)/rhodanese-related sulfurtransferase
MNKVIYSLFTLLIVTTISNAKVKSVQDLLDEAHKVVVDVDTQGVLDKLKENPNIPIIDVRPKSDVDEYGYIKANKVTRIHRAQLEWLIAQTVDENEEFIIHCNNGHISLLAALQLQKMGYKKVLHYGSGSFNAWRDENLPRRYTNKYKESPLYSEVKEISKGVYTSIGVTAPYLYESTAHNNNLGFVIGDDSVLVWNAGSSYLLAQSLHMEIKKITSKPVKYVLLENSQGHALLGTSYWQEQGATVVAQEIVKDEIDRKGDKIFIRMQNVLKDKFVGTKLAYPNKYFKDNMKFDLGGRVVEAKYFGYAHEHSDIAIWLEKEKILFAGDIAFNDRLLPIFKITNTAKWLEAWEKVEALGAKIVVPGHGHTSDMAEVRKYTKDYLVYMRTKILDIIDNDGDMTDAYNMDLSAYEHLDTFKELSKGNLSTLYKQLEFE